MSQKKRPEKGGEKKKKTHMERTSEWNKEAIINRFENRRGKVMHPIVFYVTGKRSGR